MKKWFLILLTFCLMQTGYSQTEKGKMFIGGQVGLTGNTMSIMDSLSLGDHNKAEFTISPNIGYFIKDNFAIGGTVTFGTNNITDSNETFYSTSKFKYTNNTNSIIYGIGGFARKYINITDKFKFYVNYGINYQYETQKSTYSSNNPDYTNLAIQKIEVSSISFAVTPGLVYFITPKIGIQTTFGNLNYSFSSYKNTSLNYENYNNSTNYGLNLNFSSLSIGLNYYF